MQSDATTTMWLKEISLQLHPGQIDQFWLAQSVWDSESARCPGYLGTIQARPASDEALILVFWRDRQSLERFMRLDHDRIAAQAGSEAHYESIRVRQFEARAVEQNLASAFLDQST